MIDIRQQSAPSTEMPGTFATAGSSQGQMIFRDYNPMGRQCVRRFVPIAAAILSAFAAGQASNAQDSAAAARPTQPVLVELFTSEGCSSCPPADALLARLDATQFVPGAHAIVLSEHVTYWNHLGWRDPFSLDSISERQQAYATRFGLSGVYTPQVVVDGAAEVVGSDAGAVERAVAQAAMSAKPELTIPSVAWQGDTLHFAVQGTGAQHLVLMAALAEDATQVSVSKGENAGRVLQHVAVVRVLKEMGLDAADGLPLTLKLPEEETSKDQKRGLRVVVFLIDKRSGKVGAVSERQVGRT
jgi:hypothetical protein